MSAYVKVATEFTDPVCILAALKDCGFMTVEQHETPQPLVGYRGDKRAQTAHIIVRRQYMGAASNDLGFVRTESGAYELIVSDYDRGALPTRLKFKNYEELLGHLKNRYAVSHTVKEAKRLGYQVVGDIPARGEVKLRLVRHR